MPHARCRARRPEGRPWPSGRETGHRSRLYRSPMRSKTRKARTDRRRPAGPLERHAAAPPGADGARAPSWPSRGARRADAATTARAVPDPSRRRRSVRATSADSPSDRPWCSIVGRRTPRPDPSRQQRRPPMRRSRERPHRRRMSTRHVVSALDCPRRQPPPESRSSLGSAPAVNPVEPRGNPRSSIGNGIKPLRRSPASAPQKAQSPTSGTEFLVLHGPVSEPYQARPRQFPPTPP